MAWAHDHFETGDSKYRLTRLEIQFNSGSRKNRLRCNSPKHQTSLTFQLVLGKVDLCVGRSKRKSNRENILIYPSADRHGCPPTPSARGWGRHAPTYIVRRWGGGTQAERVWPGMTGLGAGEGWFNPAHPPPSPIPNPRHHPLPRPSFTYPQADQH